MHDITFPLRWRIALLAPALAVFIAFWLLPIVALLQVSADGSRVRHVPRAARQRPLHEEPRRDRSALDNRDRCDARAVGDFGAAARTPRISRQAHAARAADVSTAVSWRRRR